MNMKNIINFIYPKGMSCVNCSSEIFDDPTLICDYCKKSLPYLSGKLCLHCSNIITGSGKYCLHCKGKKFDCDKIISPFIYDGIIKKFIVGLKFNNKKYYAQSLAYYMAMTFLKENFPCDIITCVPICNKRLKQRGYNQAELLASEFAKIVNIDFDPAVLKRVKETPTQIFLNYSDRQKNLIDAFKVDKKIVKDKNVVIIDDVYTTGATITECSKALKKAGAKTVYAVTACHTIFKNDNV